MNYTVSGTALNGADYDSLPGSVTIPPNMSSAIIPVSPLDDQAFEGTETVELTISSGALYDIGTPSTAAVSILDNDLPTVSIAATVATVPEQGSGTGQFTLSRTGITTSPLTVNYAVGGTAYEGDFQNLSGSVTIPAGVAVFSIFVTPIDDLDFEGDETVTLILLPSTAYNLGTVSASVTIVDNDLPVVTIATTVPTVPEQGPGSAQLIVSRTGINSSPLTVNFMLSGTAADGVDFQAIDGMVTIPPSASSTAISVFPIDDLAYEGDETVTVTLSPAPSYTLGSAKSATVTIVENDLPTVTVVTTVPSVPEQGSGSAQFTVSRTGITSSPLTVSYNVAGTATAGSDYGELIGTVAFSSGATTAIIFVTPIDDSTYDGNETVTITLSPSASYNTVPGNTATVTIVDNDLPIVTAVATDPSAYEADQDPGRFTIYRTENTSKPLTVNYIVTGTATNGTDYRELSGTVTIASGSSSSIITVTPVDDEEFEGPETVVLTILPSSPYKVGSPASATLTIGDNDLPSVSIAAITSSFLETGPAKGEFKISRTGITNSALLVSWTVSGTAVSGADYVPLPLSATIPANAVSTSIFVTAIDDSEYEGNETIILALAASALYNVASPSTARITLIDNDVPTVTVSTPDPNAAESESESGQFTITRTGITSSPLVVYYTLAGTALNGIDYTTLPNSVTIQTGASSANVTVRPIDDGDYEGDETVVLSLASNSSYQAGSPSNGIVTIKDNDLPTVSIITTTPNASELGPTPGLLTVSRSGITTSSLTVSYYLGGTATPGTDYVELPGTLVIPANSSSQTITVTPKNDDVIEGVETVDVTILSSDSYNIGAPIKGTVIIADDVRPLVSIVATDPNASEKGPDTGLFTISRTGATTEPLVVAYALSGSATNGTDYALITSPVTIPANAASVPVFVAPLQDTEYEGAETVVLTISPAQDYKISAQSIATVTIADDDRPIVAIAATNPDAAEPAVSGLFTVSRTGSPLLH